MNSEPMYLGLSESDLDTKVYRIIPIERMFQLFHENKNVLVRPKLWSDPWENLIFNSTFKRDDQIVDVEYKDRIYGQCWTYETASDAMWQIYSPIATGVRIKTSIRKLANIFCGQMRKWTHSQCAIGEVAYLREKKFEMYRKDPFPHGVNQESFFDSLLKKRNAYKHENELRILFTSSDDNDDAPEWFSDDGNLFFSDFDARNTIEQIMLHPGLDPALGDVMKTSISNATGFPIDKIKRSLLYKKPDPITVAL